MPISLDLHPHKIHTTLINASLKRDDMPKESETISVEVSLDILEGTFKRLSFPTSADK